MTRHERGEIIKNAFDKIILEFGTIFDKFLKEIDNKLERLTLDELISTNNAASEVICEWIHTDVYKFIKDNNLPNSLIGLQNKILLERFTYLIQNIYNNKEH